MGQGDLGMKIVDSRCTCVNYAKRLQTFYGTIHRVERGLSHHCH